MPQVNYSSWTFLTLKFFFVFSFLIMFFFFSFFVNLSLKKNFDYYLYFFKNLV